MPLNVLPVVHYPVFGGPHNQALRLGGPLSNRGYQTTVLIPDEPGNAAERLMGNGVETMVLPLHRLRAVAKLRTALAFVTAFWREVGNIGSLIGEREIAPAAMGRQAKVGPIPWLFRFPRDYGPHIALLPCAMVAGMIAIPLPTSANAAEAASKVSFSVGPCGQVSARLWPIMHWHSIERASIRRLALQRSVFGGWDS